MNKKVSKLYNLPQPAQRSKEWFIQRNSQITASEVASCLFLKKDVIKAYNETFTKAQIKENPKKGANNYESLDEYIKKKCKIYYSNNYEPFKDTVYTLHGKLFEPVATRFYSIYKKCKVNDFGLITHQKFKWLAASPDGITDNGVMLEIKCPLSRKIDINSIPFGYWLQTQIQMEVCDLEECDFLECEITNINKDDFYSLDEEILSKGLAGIIIEKNHETKDFIYPDTTILNKNDYKNFESNCYKNIYYIIKNWNIINLKRNKDWFMTIKKDLFDVYKTIQKYQKNENSYHKYLESFNGPLYSKSLIQLDEKEIEFTEEIIFMDIDMDVEIDIDTEEECNISC